MNLLKTNKKIKKYQCYTFWDCFMVRKDLKMYKYNNKDIIKII